MKNKPIAVCVSDVHYNLQTYKFADAAMLQAIRKAEDLQVPLVVAGDLHDSKANMRAECVNAMLDTFKQALGIEVYIISGNHDMVNERSEDHALNFLREYATVVDIQLKIFKPYGHNFYLIPYYPNPAALTMYLKDLPKGATLIMHQGLKSSISGDYIQDHSAITKEAVAGFRVISGHYHTRQTIALPEGGKWDYIGNPYTLGFGEANDPPKGFQVLYDDGSAEFIPTNLRKHVVYETTYDELYSYENPPPVVDNSQDLVWVKIRGSQDKLSKLNKYEIEEILGYIDFKLELIPDDIEISDTAYDSKTSPNEALDSVIESSSIDSAQKNRIKDLWKTLLK